MRRPALLALGLLSACTHLAPQTARELSRLSPLTADPAGFAIAIDLPPGAAIAPGSARLSLSATRRDTGASAAGNFTLRQTGTSFRVDPGDLSRLRALQSRIAAWEASDPEATAGSLSLTLVPCATHPPAPDATVSAQIRTRAGGPALPLLRRMPLARYLAQSGIDALPPCEDHRH